MAHILALNDQGRFPVPAIGDFLYSPEHERHVWRNRIAESAQELAALTNEALPALRALDNPYISMTVIEVPGTAPAVETRTLQEKLGDPELVQLKCENLELRKELEALRRPLKRKLSTVEESN